MHRTWSILRWFPKAGAPRPVRARVGALIWGSEAKAGPDQDDTDNDSLLLLRSSRVFSCASCSHMFIHLGVPGSPGMGEVPSIVSHPFSSV